MFISPLIRSKSLSKSNYEAFGPGPDAGTVSFSVGEQGVLLLSFLWLSPYGYPLSTAPPTPPKTVLLYVSSAAQIRPAVLRRSQRK